MCSMKDCVAALALKRGITKVEAASMFVDVMGVIKDAIIEKGGVTYKGQFTIKQKIRKGRSGNLGGKEWHTLDKKTLAISVGSDLDAELNPDAPACDSCKV